MKKYILFTIIFLIFISCNNVENSKISKNEATRIFIDLVKTKPINCVVATIKDNGYIICLAKKNEVNDSLGSEIFTLYKLSKFANKWRIEDSKEVIKEKFRYINFHYDDGKNYDFEITLIKDKAYLYLFFDTHEMGNALGSTKYNFTLIALSDFNVTNLIYEAYDTGDKEDFINLKEFKSNSIVLKFLEEKAKKSKFIYRPTFQDLDINDPINYEKRWRLDNNLRSIWDMKNNLKNEKINVTYYTSSIFPKDFPDEQSIENVDFKIINGFRSDILGYDKLKKKYFPIWFDNGCHGCNKKIEFINSSTLKITYIESNNEMILVDLNQMIYDFILK
jgi:hypothetical protein